MLSLYIINRYKSPQVKDGDTYSKSDWNTVDTAVTKALASGKNIRFVTNSMVSPSSKKAVAELSAKYSNVKVVTYDAVSYAGALDANLADFGKRALPSYHFDKAKVIVSFDADFLGSYMPSGDVSADYIKGRDLSDANNPKMSRHFQVESHMSLTGSNADNRVLVKPSEMGSAIAYLLVRLLEEVQILN